MKSRILPIFISFMLLATSNFSAAANLCELQPFNGSAKNLQSVSCQLELKSLGCDSYFKANHIPDDKKRSCDDSSTSDSFLASCGQGAGGFFSALYNFTIGRGLQEGEKQAIENRQKAVFEKACEEDHSLAIKRSLEASARLEGVTRTLNDDELRNRSCGSLMQAVQARANFRQFQDYVNKLDSKEFRSQWDEARKKFFVDLKTKVIQAADKAGVVIQCYNHAAQVEIGCKVASALVAGVLVSRTLALGPSGAVGEEMEIASAADEELYNATKPKDLSKWEKLSPDQARAIIGDESINSTEKVRRAIGYINSKTYQNAAMKADDIETLFTDISKHSHEWDFKRLSGSDGSSVFVGDAGYAVIVNPEGQLFKGSIDYKYFDSGRTWAANYSDLDLVPARSPAPPPAH